MSAERLREAAALIRERAEAASSAPWHVEAGSAGRQSDGSPWPALYVAHADRVPRFRTHSVSDASHIASWHPGVAFAVADWLDTTADHSDATGGHCVCDDAALAVADAYLGATQ